MTYTTEPKGLAFINNLNATTFSSVTSQCLWIVGSLALTAADFYMLVTGMDGGEVLAGMLLGAWGVKSGLGVVDKDNKLKRDVTYAAVVAGNDPPMPTTKERSAMRSVTIEHPAPIQETTVNVEQPRA